MKKQIQSGMTLIELTVVLIILVAMAGLVVPYMTGTSNQALCDATDLSMQNLKKIIMERYYLDTLGHFPASKGGTDYSLNYLMEQGGWDAYDPETGVGWRGPYLATGAMLTQERLNALDPKKSSFSAIFPPTTPGAPAYVHFDIVGHIQPTTIPHVLDAWGRPIILQIPYETSTGTPIPQPEYARLVSAGPTLSQAAIDTKIQYDKTFVDSNGVPHPLPDALDRNNDRVLYLKMTDPFPGGNQSCGG